MGTVQTTLQSKPQFQGTAWPLCSWNRSVQLCKCVIGLQLLSGNPESSVQLMQVFSDLAAQAQWLDKD